MKKKFMGIALVLASVLFVGTVYAEDTVNDGPSLLTCMMNGGDENGVCKLSDDIPNAPSVFTTAGKTVTLDLNGHNITLPNSGSSIMVMAGSSLTIKGDGKIFTKGNSGQAINVLAGGSLTVLDATINSESGAAGIVVFGGGEKTNVSIGPNAKVSANSTIGGVAIMGGSGGNASNVNVTIEGTVTNSGGSAVLIPSSVGKTENGATVDVKSGAKISATGENGSAINLGGYSNINVSGGTLSSANGYAIETGTEGNVNISGGDFSAPKQASAISYSAGANNNVSMTISGGEFSSLSEDILNKFIEGEAIVDENGNIIVKPEEPSPTPTPGPEPTPTPEPKPTPDDKDDEPNTSDFIYMSLLALGTIASGCYVFKKVNE